MAHFKLWDGPENHKLLLESDSARLTAELELDNTKLRVKTAEVRVGLKPYTLTLKPKHIIKIQHFKSVNCRATRF